MSTSPWDWSTTDVLAIIITKNTQLATLDEKKGNKDKDRVHLTASIGIQ